MDQHPPSGTTPSTTTDPAAATPSSTTWGAATGPAGPTPTADGDQAAGAWSAAPPPPPPPTGDPFRSQSSGGKRLYRKTEKKLFLGVCSGLAEYFDLDTTIVRAAFVAGSLLVGTGFVLYLVLALVMPAEESLDLDPRIAAQQTVDEAVSEVRRGVDAVTTKARDLTGRKNTTY